MKKFRFTYWVSTQWLSEYFDSVECFENEDWRELAKAKNPNAVRIT